MRAAERLCSPALCPLPLCSLLHDLVVGKQHTGRRHPSLSVRPQHALNAFLVTGHLRVWSGSNIAVDVMSTREPCLAHVCWDPHVKLFVLAQQPFAQRPVLRTRAAPLRTIAAQPSSISTHPAHALCVLAHRLPRQATGLPLGPLVVQWHCKRRRPICVLMLRLVCRAGQREGTAVGTGLGGVACHAGQQAMTVCTQVARVACTAAVLLTLPPGA